jgi:hypothetical protein
MAALRQERALTTSIDQRALEAHARLYRILTLMPQSETELLRLLTQRAYGPPSQFCNLRYRCSRP